MRAGLEKQNGPMAQLSIGTCAITCVHLHMHVDTYMYIELVYDVYLKGCNWGAR